MEKFKFSKNIFHNARLTLTAYYVLIMFLIILLFSSILILTIETRIRNGLDGKIVLIDEDTDPAKDVSKEIELLIYLTDGFLLAIIGLASYFLADRTLKPIKNNLEAQKKFSADASHDLRTPISIIITENEVALNNVNSNKEDFKKVIISNLEEALKMRTLVNDLLLIARGENNKIIKEKVDLSLLVNITCDKSKIQIEQKNLNFITDVSPNIYIDANKIDLERAITNILQNAINYTETGSIKIELEKIHSKIELKITDTGVGIKKEDLPFIYDRFFKAEHSRNDHPGSGLGLHIAKEIIENMGGRIEIQSQEKVGTKVEIAFTDS